MFCFGFTTGSMGVRKIFRAVWGSVLFVFWVVFLFLFVGWVLFELGLWCVLTWLCVTFNVAMRDV